MKQSIKYWRYKFKIIFDVVWPESKNTKNKNEIDQCQIMKESFKFLIQLDKKNIRYLHLHSYWCAWECDYSLDNKKLKNLRPTTHPYFFIIYICFDDKRSIKKDTLWKTTQKYEHNIRPFYPDITIKILSWQMLNVNRSCRWLKLLKTKFCRYR